MREGQGGRQRQSLCLALFGVSAMKGSLCWAAGSEMPAWTMLPLLLQGGGTRDPCRANEARRHLCAARQLTARPRLTPAGKLETPPLDSVGGAASPGARSGELN
jgi:hypothetical protein